jgi:hypothetical protein
MSASLMSGAVMLRIGLSVLLRQVSGTTVKNYTKFSPLGGILVISG